MFLNSSLRTKVQSGRQEGKIRVMLQSQRGKEEGVREEGGGSSRWTAKGGGGRRGEEEEEEEENGKSATRPG